MRPNSTAAILGCNKDTFVKLLRLVIARYSHKHAIASSPQNISEDAQRLESMLSAASEQVKRLWGSLVLAAQQCPDGEFLSAQPNLPAVPGALWALLDKRNTNTGFAKDSDKFLRQYEGRWWNRDGEPSGRNNVYRPLTEPDSASDGEAFDGDGANDDDGMDLPDFGIPPADTSSSNPSSSTLNHSSNVTQSGLLGTLADIAAQEHDKAHSTGSGGKDDGQGSRKGGGSKKRDAGGGRTYGRGATPAPGDRTRRSKRNTAAGAGQGAPSPLSGAGGGGDGPSSSDDDDGEKGSRKGGGGRKGKKRSHRHRSSSSSSSSSASDLDFDSVRGTKPTADDKADFILGLGAYFDDIAGAEDPHTAETSRLARAALEWTRSKLERVLQRHPLKMGTDVAIDVLQNRVWDLPKVSGFTGAPSSNEAALRELSTGEIKLEATAASKSKPIETAFEWERCFTECEKLSLAVYAHRKDEYRVYREHLRQLMADEPELLSLWLEYDVQFRKTLGQLGRAKRLDDVVNDTYLRQKVVYSSSAYLRLKTGNVGRSTGGSGSGSGGGGKAKAKKQRVAAKPGERCNNFNNRKGQCKDDGPCKLDPPRLHLCTFPGCEQAHRQADHHGGGSGGGRSGDLNLDLEPPTSELPSSLPGLSEHPRVTRFLSYTSLDPPHSKSLEALAASSFPIEPPSSLLEDPLVQRQLEDAADLLDFEHRTPYDLDKLEELLTSGATRYPDQELVKRYLYIMRHGAWPFHDGDFSDAKSFDYPKSKEELKFAEAQGHAAYEEGRMSAPFKTLKPGMTASPTFVRHPAGGKDRWIFDQTASNLNAHIPSSLTSPTYDLLDSLIRLMRHILTLPPSQRADVITVWRGDIKSAFWGMPVHVLWQMRQAVRFVDEDGNEYYRLDYRLQFGNRASPYLWALTEGFLLWLAQRMTSIEHPFAFVDDAFGADGSGVVVKRVHRDEQLYLPKQLDELLSTWDVVKAPYELLKQLSTIDPHTGAFRNLIRVLGLVIRVHVDPRKCTVEVPEDQKKRFALLSEDFAKGEKVSVGKWRTWLGKAQFVGVVTPWAKWRLNRLYADLAKLERDFNGSGKGRVRVKDYQTEIVFWFLDQVLHATPLSLFDATLQRWTIEDADVVVWSDSCLVSASGGGGLGFVVASKAQGVGGDLGYYYRHPQPFVDNNFAEGAALYSGFETAIASHPGAKRFLLFTDSSTVVYAADAGRGSDEMLELAYRFVVKSNLTGVDFRVRHVSGRKNSRADVLSRAPFAQLRAEWGDRLRLFLPLAVDESNGVGAPKGEEGSRLRQLRDRLQKHHIKPKTARGYHSSRKNWYRFTRSNNLSSIPTAESLQLYAAYLISQGFTSLKQQFTALRDKFRRLPNWTEMRQGDDLKEVLIGAKKLYAGEIKRAAPIDPDSVKKVVEKALERRDHNGLLIAFIASIAFCGLLRLGEAAPHDLRSANPRDFPKRASFKMDENTISFRLPYSRSDTIYKGEEVVIVRELVPANLPLFDIAAAFLKSRDAWVGQEGFLFAQRDGNLISRNTVISTLKKVGPFTGHSFRSGGCTWLAEQGLSDVEIQRAGRWQSDTYKLYIRKHPSIIAASRRRAVREALARL
ncbi:hypothetical protein JCM10213_007262 [Rhodosporidiobolus nylandii]